MQRNKKLDESAAGLLRTVVLEHQKGYDSATRAIESIVTKQLLNQRFSRENAPPDTFRAFLLYALASRGSYAQLYQDLFALWALKGKRGGYFVEVGAGDGVNLSNSLLLEDSFEWSGLLCETNPLLVPKIRAQRKALLDERCVAAESGMEIPFGCAEEPEFSKVMSAPEDYHDKNGRRKIMSTVNRPTATLDEVLQENGVPNKFDFLAIDIEGAELDVLSVFPFGKWRFSVAVVEHNFSESKSALLKLFTDNGYIQLFPEFSLFDAWFVDEEVYRSLSAQGSG